MSSFYLAPDGSSIGFDDWQKLLADPITNGFKEDIIENGEYDVTLCKKYSGNATRLYVITIDCHESLTDYHGYRCGCVDPTLAESEYQRIKKAIQENKEL